jgi:LytS/YehU family sensor histidine kinase
VITATINLLLVLGITIVIFFTANAIFTLKAPKAYFLVYLTRNTTIALGVILVTYVIELVDKLRREKIEVLTLKQKNTEAELAVLKGQIDTHFFFNTLTILSSLVRSNNSETIRFIDHMADTFRYMLEARSRNVVTVRDELSFLESYLFMMKRRFEDGLRVEIDIHQDLLGRSIPQFALQALIENAIKHNIISIKQTLRIEIRSHENRIVVSNNLNEKKFTSGYGIGLDNLAQRYWLMAKKEITINKSDGSFEVSIPVL